MYIADKEVKSIDWTLVTFSDDSTKEFTERQLEYIATEEAKDSTQFRNHVCTHIAHDILKIFELHNVRKWDLEYVISLVTHSYNQMFHTAIGKKFGTYDESLKFTPQAFEENITIKDLIQ